MNDKLGPPTGQCDALVGTNGAYRLCAKEASYRFFHDLDAGFSIGSQDACKEHRDVFNDGLAEFVTQLRDAS